MRIISKLTLDIINIWSGFAKGFSQKSLQLWPRNKASALMARFMLGLLITNSSIEEKGCKPGTIKIVSLCYIKIILALLIKMIAVHIQFFIV